MGCADSTRNLFAVRDYALDLTLTSGQAFLWTKADGAWTGVVQGRWVRLRQVDEGIVAQTAEPVATWDWLEHYLQAGVDLPSILATFPADEPMRAAVQQCAGLRLLRQDPWECLASFILSSTKQIVQIQQIVGLLRARFGNPVCAPPNFPGEWSFPGPERLARCTEQELRGCKMGFRAPYLLAAARQVAEATLDLSRLEDLPTVEARARLMNIHGVGAKICDCVLLFAYGRQDAFPVDVWVAKALQQLYFPKRRASFKRLRAFSATHFGPNAGYAQQYLFHYARLHMPRKKNRKGR